MNARHTWFALALGCLGLATLAAGLFPIQAKAQKARTDPRFEYKVVRFTYNPGERLNDDGALHSLRTTTQRLRSRGLGARHRPLESNERANHRRRSYDTRYHLLCRLPETPLRRSPCRASADRPAGS